MKFIADAMLGRLARCLRILGFDVLYYRDLEDTKVVRIAREQERTILTRDTRLIGRKGLTDPVFIRSDHIADQLLEMSERLDLKEADPLGRCSICNGKLMIIHDKQEVREALPDYVYHSFDHFVRCTDCTKVYWEGSHQKEFRHRMKRIFSEQGDVLRKKRDREG